MHKSWLFVRGNFRLVSKQTGHNDPVCTRCHDIETLFALLAWFDRAERFLSQKVRDDVTVMEFIYINDSVPRLGLILGLRPYKVKHLVRELTEISNISEITSCRIMIWGSKPIYSWSRNQISTLYTTWQTIIMCVKGQKHENIQNGRQFHTLFQWMCHNFCSSCNKKATLASKPKFSCMRIPTEIK